MVFIFGFIIIEFMKSLKSMCKKITMKQFIFIKDLRNQLDYSYKQEMDNQLTCIQASYLIKKLLKMYWQKRGS